MPNFPGFPKEGLKFLRDLVKNNNREWFQKNKSVFEECVKIPMHNLVAALNADLETFAPAYCTDPKKAIFRIYRDTRFSKDKAPYKTQVAACFLGPGKDMHATAGFYFAVSAKEVHVVGGAYMPPNDRLKALRNFLAANYKEFHKITGKKALTNAMGEVKGEQLKRLPREFADDHPVADLLRNKQYFLQCNLPATTAGTPDLQKELAKRFKLMTPFVEYLDVGLRS